MPPREPGPSPPKPRRADPRRWRRVYEAILANTPDLAYVFDLDHRFVYCNPALLAMWGQTWRQAIGKNCLELGYPPWHAAKHDREIEQVIATKRPVRGDVAFTGTNGRRIYDYIFVPVQGPGGEVEAVAGTTRDVTNRVAGEDFTRRLASLVENTHDMIESAAMDGAVTYLNHAGLDMLGWDEVPAAATLRDFFPPPRADEYLAEVRALQLQGEGWEGETEFQNRRTGEVIPVHAKAFAIRDTQGGPVARGLIARDIREWRRAQDALVQGEKLAAMGRVAATVAHEINNPLAAVVNLVYLLAREPGLSPNARDLIQRTEAELERVTAITRETLGYFRSEAKMTPVALAAVLSGIMGAFSSRAAQCHVTFQAQLDSSIRVAGFASELRQVFINLIGNALDAMAEGGGTLTVSLTNAAAGGACVRIADSGPGIPEADLKRLFEPFFSNKRGGIGLGLWVSEKIVRKHGGAMSARNAEGGGACFEVWLPAREA